MSRCLPTLLAASLLALAPVPSRAAEGRIPLPNTSPVVFPIVLTSPGHYVLTRDLAAPAGTVLEIQADRVFLDLNGFGVGSPGGAPIIHSSGFDNLTIRNGTVVGDVIATNVIEIEDATTVVLEDLRIQANDANGVELTDVNEFALRRLQVDAGSTGISVVGNVLVPPYPFTGSIEDCQVDKKPNVGGLALNVARATAVAVRNNRVLNDSLRISLCDGCSVEGNTVHGGGIEVIDSTGCLVARSTMIGSAVDGLSLSDAVGCLITNNSIRDATLYGIRVAGFDVNDNTILNNVVTGSGSQGILVFLGRHRIADNLVSGNGSWGIHFGAQSHDNVYGGNIGRGNGGTAGICNGGASTADLCDESVSASNTSSGDNYLPDLR